MSEKDKKFLSVSGLKKSFGSETKQEVLKGLDFTVGKGEFCVLLGPSGSGKSTLLNILGGIDSADDGEISINGDKLEEMDEKSLTRYRRKHLGYVFQMYNLIPNLNVKENIETGAYLSDKPLDIDELLKILGLYETSKEILQLIEEVNQKYGNTIIMVTHNEAIKQMADHVIKLRDGKIRHDNINSEKLTAAEIDW